MKQLAFALALVSTPVFACPHQDQAQKTAQKTEPKKAEEPKKTDAPKPTEQAKAKSTEPAKKPS